MFDFLLILLQYQGHRSPGEHLRVTVRSFFLHILHSTGLAVFLDCKILFFFVLFCFSAMKTSFHYSNIKRIDMGNYVSQQNMTSPCFDETVKKTRQHASRCCTHCQHQHVSTLSQIWKRRAVTHPHLFSEASSGVDAALHKLFKHISLSQSWGTIQRHHGSSINGL